MQAGVVADEDGFDAGSAGDDDGKVILHNRADHRCSVLEGEIAHDGEPVDEVDACCACSEDESAHGEEDVDGDAVVAAELDVPGEDDGEDVEDEIAGHHEDGVEVGEIGQVDAVALDGWVPPFRHGNALEDAGYDAGETEGEGDDVHDEDATAGPRLEGELGVEEEEGVLDGPIDGEVEDQGGHDHLGMLS